MSGSVTGQAAVLSELVAAHLETTLKKTGLSMGAFELLSAVKGSPSAPQAELAANLGITPSSFCEAVRTAMGKGLVEQEGSDTDRRAKRIVMTRKGSRALEEALTALKEAEGRATEGIADGRLAAAVEVLRQASKNLSKEFPGS